MAKTKAVALTKKDAVTLLTNDIVTAYGPRAARWLIDVPEKGRTSTGIERLDTYLGGGVIVGGTIEIFGSHGNGKTSVALSIASHVNGVVVYMDAERKITPATVRRFGGEKNFLICYPPYLEKAFEWTEDFLLRGAKMVVFDSLPAFIPKKEFDNKDMEKQPGVALTAGFLARIMGKFNAMADEFGATIVVVNQNRANQNLASPWAEPYHQFGGYMLPSIASMRLKVSKGLDIRPETKKYEPLGIIGHRVAIRVAKSSVGPSQQTCEMPLVYARGFVDHTLIHAVKEELLVDLAEGRYFPVRFEEVSPEITIEEVRDAQMDMRAMKKEQEEDGE